MTMSVGQSMPATAFARDGAEPGAEKDPQPGGFADLLAGKTRPAGDAKKAAPAKHDVVGDLPDTGQADDADLASILKPAGKKAPAAGKADERNDAKTDDQPQPAREKLPELISLQQLGALPTQPNQPPQTTTGTAAAGYAAANVAQFTSTPIMPQGKQQAPTDPGDLMAGQDAIDQPSPKALPNPTSAPVDTVSTEATGEAMPADKTQGLLGLLDNGAVTAKAAPEPRNAVEKHAASADFTVKAQQSFPAPAAQPISTTAAALVTALDSGLRQASATHAALLQPAQTVAVPAHILKIELHPAELGSVVASLRLSGQQLSVEIRPETHEAHRRLSADTEALAKSLRSLGFDVDSVTVLQPSVAAPLAARADGPGPMSQAGRDQPSFQPGGSDSRGDGQAGQQSGRNRNHETQEAARAAPPVRERGGGDLFI